MISINNIFTPFFTWKICYSFGKWCELLLTCYYSIKFTEKFFQPPDFSLKFFYASNCSFVQLTCNENKKPINYWTCQVYGLRGVSWCLGVCFTWLDMTTPPWCREKVMVYYYYIYIDTTYTVFVNKTFQHN